MGSQKVLGSSGKLPIGRATAQPRVNMSGAYSPYASTRDVCGDQASSIGDMDMEILSEGSSTHKTLQDEDFETEDVAQASIEQMMSQLQQLQHDLAH